MRLCNKPIAYGNAAVTINKNIEQMDRTGEHPDGIVTLIQSDAVTTLCAGCGNQLNVEALRKILSIPISKTRRKKASRWELRVGLCLWVSDVNELSIASGSASDTVTSQRGRRIRSPGNQPVMGRIAENVAIEPMNDNILRIDQTPGIFSDSV